MRNKYKSRAFWGTIIGTSLGIVISSNMSPINKRKLMKTTRRMASDLKDGINSLWY